MPAMRPDVPNLPPSTESTNSPAALSTRSGPGVAELARLDVHRDSPARAVVQRYLAINAEALRRADGRTRRDEADAVHQMRVSSRRLRSALRSFRPLLDWSWAKALRNELSWLSGELGAFRESEVLAARCDTYSEPDTSSARTVLDGVLRDRLSEARSRTIAALESDRYAVLLDALDEGCRHPSMAEAADRPAIDALPPCVADEWSVLRRRATSVLDAEQNTPAPDADWHAARIAAKRARYAVDAVVPAIDDAAEALADRMSDVTDVLGEHQDASQMADLAANLAAELAGPGPDDAVISLGAVNRVERDRVTMARHEFTILWPNVDTPWLTGWFTR